MKLQQKTPTRITTLLQKVGIVLSLAVLLIGIVPTPTSAQAIQCDTDFYESNTITFFNPCEESVCSTGSGSLTGPAPSSLTGETNQEKAWNYFAARGLTPMAAAGAMGNIQAESSFSASVEESNGIGLGIIQWSYERRTNLESAAAAAGISLHDNDAALLFQLNYLWDGEYKAMTWQEQVNAETTVEGNTAVASFWGGFNDARRNYDKEHGGTQVGNGSTMVFHALVERSGDVPTEADRISGHGVLTHRIDNAKGFLEQFGAGSDSEGCGSIGAGGLSFDHAVTVSKKLMDNWDSIYCGTGSVKNGQYCSWTSGYCTAGAAWMAELTAPDPTKVPGIPDGVNVAGRLVSDNSEVYTSANPDGSNLQPFSIWSFGIDSATGGPGHTGMIVGIGTDGSIVTLETNWAAETTGATDTSLYNPGHRAAVFQYPSFEAFKASRGSYVYNTTATPKDSSIAAEMGKKVMAFMGN